MPYRLAKYSAAPLVFLSLCLAACGGGGGGGGITPGGGGPTPTPTPVQTPTTTPFANASGRVVDDATGTALAGIKVGLAPWVAAATPVPEGTTAPDGSFAFTAAPGHYLLVIGSDLSSDTTRATIHDNVTLVGGANALQAPVLPPWPTVTPPPWETNGTYRIAAIDATTMLPCFNSYNSHRTSNGLAATVFDEWLLENVRDVTKWHRSGVYNPANQTPASHALSSGNSFGGGGTDCANTTLGAAYTGGAAPYSGSANNQWFGGTYVSSFPGDGAAFGVAEFPLDPRFQTDPIGNWP